MSAKISVVIPVYKVEQYIRQCLDSVIGQTYQNLEIILVDDGSPDNCGAICDEYAQKDARVKVIHKENGGLCAARNEGLACATGDWIALVDSDDWCELDYYERFIKEIGNSCPDIFWACSHFIEYNGKSQVLYDFKNSFMAKGRAEIRKYMSQIAHIGLPWDKLYRRSFLIENNLLFDTRIKSLEDHLFNFQAFDLANMVAGAVFAGYHNRVVATSIVNGYNPDKAKQTHNTLSILDAYIHRKDLPNELRKVVYFDAMVGIRFSLSSYYFHPRNKKSYVEVAKELKELKSLKYYHAAIWDKDSSYLSKKQRILKYALRLPWIWPVKVLYLLKKFTLERK